MDSTIEPRPRVLNGGRWTLERLLNGGRWTLERVLFALAGTMTLLSVVLALAISDWFLLLTVFVGVNQWLYVTVRACPASIFLRRACHLRSAIYDEEPGGSPDIREVAI